MNVIYLIIDSLCYERLSSLKQNFGEDSFLNELSQKGLSFTKMYSQAPFTEAAAQAMYCGQKTLDNNGHLFRFRDAEWTIFEKAKNRGMTTFYSNVLLQLYTSSTRRGVDICYYNNGFELGGLWNYRLSYYQKLYNSKELKGYDYDNLIALFDENFSEWLRFFTGLEKQSEEVRLLLSNYYQYDTERNHLMMEKEYEKYCTDKKAYIDSVLKEGRKHCLFQIDEYLQSQKIDDSFKHKIWRTKKRTIRRIRKKQFGCNFKSFLFNRDSILETKKVLKTKKLRNLKTYLGNEYLFLFPVLLKKKVFSNYDSYKVAPSIETFIQSFISWRNTNRLTDYFACIHVDDIHHTEVFFTYDSEDESTVGFDFSEADRLTRKVSNKYVGPLLYDLGIFYIGRKIKDLYDYIERIGELDNTLFVITSDHGFSYQGTPTREKNISTFYKENYHIPAIFYLEGKESQIINDYHNSYEIPQIILNYVDNKPITKSDGFATIEYMGSGCPDVYRRPIKLACFDDEFFVCGDFLLSEIPSIDKCTVYDLINDPCQSHPLLFDDLREDVRGRVNTLFYSIRDRLETLAKKYKR